MTDTTQQFHCLSRHEQNWMCVLLDGMYTEEYYQNTSQITVPFTRCYCHVCVTLSSMHTVAGMASVRESLDNRRYKIMTVTHSLIYSTLTQPGTFVTLCFNFVFFFNSQTPCWPTVTFSVELNYCVSINNQPQVLHSNRYTTATRQLLYSFNNTSTDVVSRTANKITLSLLTLCATTISKACQVKCAVVRRQVLCESLQPQNNPV